ncbi:unnamed protein product [Sphenostylis stenocarpa]|uniref:Xylanase inhibitor C-terminal domain-containing protein n=1 Tax=Sphenostylis stenocarpa TaxID=92480 RepID=A0AA86TFE9_9FABA|nr:unnamed protein product [Sphenostylis stenocarpa]
MLWNPKHPYFYCIGLVGISIGERTIPVPDMLPRVNRRGDDGVVVDNGTTFTMLLTSLYNAVVSEFDGQVGQLSTDEKK